MKQSTINLLERIIRDIHMNVTNYPVLIGGSLALNNYQLLDRSAHDIDLNVILPRADMVVVQNIMNAFIRTFKLTRKGKPSGYEFGFKPKSLLKHDHFSMVIGCHLVEVCIAFHDINKMPFDEEERHTIYQQSLISLKYDSPIFMPLKQILAVKYNYAINLKSKSRTKHFNDLVMTIRALTKNSSVKIDKYASFTDFFTQFFGDVLNKI